MCTLVCSSSQILSVLSKWSQIMKVHLNLSNGRMFTNHVSSSLESSVVGTWKQLWHQARWARPNHPKQWITTQNTRLQIHEELKTTQIQIHFLQWNISFLFLQEEFPNELQIDFARRMNQRSMALSWFVEKRGEKIFHYDKELRKWKWTLKGSSKVKEAKSWKRLGENTSAFRKKW